MAPEAPPYAQVHQAAYAQAAAAPRGHAPAPSHGPGGGFMTSETRGSNNNYARAEGQVRPATPTRTPDGASPRAVLLFGMRAMTQVRMMSRRTSRGCALKSALADALPGPCVRLQNLGNFLTDRNSSRVLAPPGGASSIVFGA